MHTNGIFLAYQNTLKEILHSFVGNMNRNPNHTHNHEIIKLLDRRDSIV